METPERVAITTSISYVTNEIHDTAHRQLGTAIVVLAPMHKCGDERQESLATCRRLLLSTAHMLELDLLRVASRSIIGSWRFEGYYGLLISLKTSLIRPSVCTKETSRSERITSPYSCKI
jgi:hypothetical protein